ncbi:hypothetical protein HUT11_35625 (plasmid) [Streptomyces seoulensis]|nr:hypothetical protein HUT11_35625 [Streptomyces seoulensis]
MTENNLNNGRNHDPVLIAFLTATAVWLAGQLTHNPDSANQFAAIVLPYVPPLLERR